MTSSEIRKRFLRFFEEKGHHIVAGSSLVPEDPSLLLTTAGMVQFIPIFKGEIKPDFPRAATVQRCLRTTDIEEVGRTARHLTFFEMLGNFSFGDYYKKEAISWAWDFVIKNLKIDPKKLWITIFEEDDAAFDIWHKGVGLEKDRIVRLGEKDNFWKMGPVGPCGPSSELIYDRGRQYSCGSDCAIGCDCDRYVELWNLVFMQYYRSKDGKLTDLPKKNIDTGAGLERLAAVLQGKSNAFECDVLKPLVDAVSSLAGIKYGVDESKDVSLKIVADHARAVVFMINDGVLPSNEGRGYVLRRLLRRAVRHGRLLGIRKLFMVELCDKVIDGMGKAYPEVAENRAFIAQIVKGEEKRFAATLKQGLSLLADFIKQTEQAGRKKLSGKDVFKLYDTFGFPVELTKEIASERGREVDEPGFGKLMDAAREKARRSWEEKGAVAKDIYTRLLDRFSATRFVGYSETEAQVEIQALVSGDRTVKSAGAGEAVEVVLAKTPFYAEMGGQVGDTGMIETKTGRIAVSDTVAGVGGLVVHRGKVKAGKVSAGQKAEARVNGERRDSIRRNHTATHLLHWALRIVFGPHVRQSGSLVDDKRLRFDFTHPGPLVREEIEHIERLINRRVMEDHPVKAYTTTYKFAVESGATAFFGEKYGKYVRVLEVGDFSRELCGGTHVSSTGQIGLFKMVSEGSVGANLRRIEAMTGQGALAYVEEEERVLSSMAAALKGGTTDLHDRLRTLIDTLKEREHEISALKGQLASAEVGHLAEHAVEKHGVKVVIGRLDGKDMEALRLAVDQLKARLKTAVIVLGSVHRGRANLVIGATPTAAKKGIDAAQLIKTLGDVIGGGGGGRTELAQAGGGRPDKVADALKKAERLVDETIRS